jgi:hypothetical protein
VTRRRQTRQIDDVLDAHRHAMQRAAPPPGQDLPLGRLGADMAASASGRMNALSLGLSRSIRSSSAVVSSTGDSSRAEMARAAAVAVSQCTSLIGLSSLSSAAKVRRARIGRSLHPRGAPLAYSAAAIRSSGNSAGAFSRPARRASSSISALSIVAVLDAVASQHFLGRDGGRRYPQSLGLRSTRHGNSVVPRCLIGTALR